MNEDTSQREVFARFGLAAYSAQCLEMEAGNLMMAYIRVAGKIEKRSILDAVERFIDRDTLGRLLKEIKKIVTFDETVQEFVGTALEQRNYLTHSFFRTHDEAFLSDQGRKIMIEELDGIRFDLSRADKLLHSLSVTILKTLGYTEKQIENYPLKEEFEQGASHNDGKPPRES